MEGWQNKPNGDLTMKVLCPIEECHFNKSRECTKDVLILTDSHDAATCDEP